MAASVCRQGINEALDGGSPCRLSILRNHHVPCVYFVSLNVNYKIALGPESILRHNRLHVDKSVLICISPCRISILRKKTVAKLDLMVKGPSSGKQVAASVGETTN